MKKKLFKYGLLIILLISFGQASYACFTPPSNNWVGDTSTDWDDPLNWDGDALPLDGEDVIVDPTFGGYNNDPVVISGTGSSFTPRAIRLVGSVTLTINDALSATTLQNASSATGNLTMGGTGNLTLSGDIQLVTGGTMTIDGSGTISVGDDIAFTDDGATLVNNMTGAFSLSDDIYMSNGDVNNILTNNQTISCDEIYMRGDGGLITNNGTINSSNRIQFRSDNNTITNGGTITVTNDIYNRWNGYDGNVVNNNATLSFSGFDLNDGDFTFNNTSNVTQTGSFTGIVAASSFNNYSGSTWNYAGTGHDTDVALDCVIDGENEFIYDRNGAQEIISSLEYYNLRTGGTGTKTFIGDVGLKGDLDFSANSSFDFVTNRVSFTGADRAQNILNAPSSNIIFYDLTVNNTSGVVPALIFDSNVLNPGVSNDATLTQGIVDISNTSSIEFQFNSATTTASSDSDSFIDGKASKLTTVGTSFEFPIGSGTKWAPLSIANVSNAQTYVAEYFYSDYGNSTVSGLNNVSTLEYWTLTIGAASTTDVSLHWKNDMESQIVDHTDLVVAHFNSGSSFWESYGRAGGSAGPAPGYVTATGISTFGDFTFGSATGTNPLPIELVNFKGRQIDNGIVLNWQTASELNNDFFTLRRSYDGAEFEIIAAIEGAGNSSSALNYTYDDYPAKSGVIYYQLTQTDFNGTSETFDMIGVRYELKSDLIQVYPNPVAGNELTILFPEEQKGKVAINIYSLIGEIIFQKEFTNPAIYLSLSLDKIRRKGIYFLRIDTGTKRFTSKLYLE